MLNLQDGEFVTLTVTAATTFLQAGFNLRSSMPGLFRSGGADSAGTRFIYDSGYSEVTHTEAKSTYDGQVRFSATWRSAKGTTGAVTFTAWVNAVDGTGGTENDRSSEATVSVTVTGCTMPTCAELRSECGLVANVCGATLNCGAASTCASGVCQADNRCLPTDCYGPAAEVQCPAAGANCGIITGDACSGGLQFECGPGASGPNVCGGAGGRNVLGCTPIPQEVACAGKCGEVSDDCGGAYSCGSCVCGDGIVGGGETCDDGPQTGSYGYCNADCSGPGPHCGDGILNGPEQCDDGNSSDVDACTNTCLLPVCGDGLLQWTEECDDGASNSNVIADACRETCLLATCGDGVADTGEGCDEGANNSDGSNATCRTTCALPTCGDGVVDTGETCDDGPSGSATCTAACTWVLPDGGVGDADVVDGGVDDAGLEDGGTVDSGVTSDSGPRIDAGTDLGVDEGSVGAGCGCSVPARSDLPGGVALALGSLLALSLARGRRKR